LALAALAGAASGEPAACNLAKVADLPVTMVGASPLVSVKVNGLDGRLVADTGSFFSMLAPASAARYGLKLGPLPPWLNIRGATGAADVHVASAKDFSVLGLELHNVDFLVGEHGFGPGADGLLGENVMSLTDAEFDLANGVIRLFQTDHCDGANLAYWAGGGTHGEMSISPIEKPGYEIQGWATVNGHRVRVTFDTGAWRSTLKTSAAKAAGIVLDGPGVTPGGASGGIGRRFISTEIAPVASFEIGGEEIKNTHLRVGDLDLEDADMLIGADFFLSHRVFVSKSQRKLFFTTTAARCSASTPAGPKRRRRRGRPSPRLRSPRQERRPRPAPPRRRIRRPTRPPTRSASTAAARPSSPVASSTWRSPTSPAPPSSRPPTPAASRPGPAPA
jgi:predicted aspartyl protease